MIGPLKEARMEAFLRHYATGMTGGAAWEKAGYNARGHSATQCASRVLRDVNIQARLTEIKGELLREVAHEFKYTILDVANELAKIGFNNIGDYTDVHGRSIILNMSKASRDNLAAVSSIKTKYVAGKDEDGNDDGTVVVDTEVKFHDKKAALIALGDHLGMFPKTVRIGGEPGNDTPIKTEEVNDKVTRREEAKMVAFYLAHEANEARLVDAAADAQQSDPVGADTDETNAEDEQEDDHDDDE